jgi:hypothetical protein
VFFYFPDMWWISIFAFQSVVFHGVCYARGREAACNKYTLFSFFFESIGCLVACAVAVSEDGGLHLAALLGFHTPRAIFCVASWNTAERESVRFIRTGVFQPSPAQLGFPATL